MNELPKEAQAVTAALNGDWHTVQNIIGSLYDYELHSFMQALSGLAAEAGYVQRRRRRQKGRVA